MKKNKVVKCLQRNSTKIAYVMIFASNILDFLWPGIFFIAIYIKNRRPIKALSGILLYKMFKGSLSILSIGFKIYYLLSYS